jgi:bacterioferritin-associated ferredoxin
MYVCVCNAITDQEVRGAVALGGENVIEALECDLNLESQVGKAGGS